MDPRSNKPYNFVAVAKNLSEGAKKVKKIEIDWLHRYQWLCDEYENVRREMQKLCEERNVALGILPEKDPRSCLPMPETVNGEYGWLAAKPEFRLEKFGSYRVKYPNPLDEVALLPGDFPNIAAGRGLI